MIDIPKNKKVILFDGVCNLCNNAVTIAIKYDKKNTFLFAAIQSESGKKILDYLDIDTSKTDSIILYESGVSYEIKSTAALSVVNDFGGIWKITKIAFLFPKAFRDIVYDFIAKNRYKWFGKKDNCMLPTAALKAKFLD
jgi:predicted DCC family thiol-disulfide oxidoreductase YuxK